MKPLKDSEYGEKTMESQETQHLELEQITGVEKEWSEKAGRDWEYWVPSEDRSIMVVLTVVRHASRISLFGNNLSSLHLLYKF